MNILAIVAAFGFLHSVDLIDVIIKPEDTVAVNGSDITLSCTVEESGNQEVLEWNEYVSVPEGNRIWWSLDPDNVERPETFEIVGAYNLKIKNIQVSDGGRYGCKLLAEEVLYPAEVSVYERSICNAMGEDLKEYDMAYISCHVPYGGSHEPEVSFYDTVTQQKLAVDTEKGANYVYISANVTAAAETDGRLYECRVKQEAPLYDDTCTTSLNVSYSVRNVSLSLWSEEYYTGEEIICTAQGNPAPHVWWENTDNVNGTSNHSSHGNVLQITAEMEGSNIWKCLAENTVSGNVSTVEEQIEFVVYSGVRTTPVVSLAVRNNGLHWLMWIICLFTWLGMATLRMKLGGLSL